MVVQAQIGLGSFVSTIVLSDLLGQSEDECGGCGPPGDRGTMADSLLGGFPLFTRLSPD